MGKLGQTFHVDFIRTEYLNEKRLWEEMRAEHSKAQSDLMDCAEDSNWEEIEELKKELLFKAARVSKQFNRMKHALAKLIRAEKHLKK